MKNTLLTSTLVLALSQTTTLSAHGEKKHQGKTGYSATSKVFGEYDPALTPVKTIEVSMADTMRFSPEELTVSAGDVVKFVVTNNGELNHEFVLGTKNSLEDHAELMIKFPNMQHEEPYMAHVDPGKTMEIIWKFTNAGSFEFGCLLPGHFDAGMRGTITVN